MNETVKGILLGLAISAVLLIIIFWPIVKLLLLGFLNYLIKGDSGIH